jgi:hypothetical protein
MKRIHIEQGGERGHLFDSPEGSSDHHIRLSHQYVQGDISSEAIRKQRSEVSNRQLHVTFGNVVIEGGGVTGTVYVGEQGEFGNDGDVLASELDREVLNAILDTGTDEKGRQALKERYAKLSPLARRQREIRLTKYSGFAMRSDGTLDYGIDTPRKISFFRGLFRRLE